MRLHAIYIYICNVVCVCVCVSYMYMYVYCSALNGEAARSGGDRSEATGGDCQMLSDAV